MVKQQVADEKASNAELRNVFRNKVEDYDSDIAVDEIPIEDLLAKVKSMHECMTEIVSGQESRDEVFKRNINNT